MKNAWLLLLGCVLIPYCLDAQSFYAIRKERGLILSLGTGTATYLGELANPGDYLDGKLNVVGGLKLNLTPRIALRSEITWFQLSGSDAKADDESRVERNLSFTSSNIEFNVTGQISLYANGNRYYRRPGINIYGFAGVGLTYFNPKTKYQGEKIALAHLETEGVAYSQITPALPVGAGIRLRMGPNVDVAIEGGYRKVFTDYLDDVSTVHLGPAAFSDPIAAALSDRRPELGVGAAAPNTQRGNPSRDDSYWLLNIKVEYYLPIDVGSNNRQRSYSKSRRNSMYRYKSGGGLRR